MKLDHVAITQMSEAGSKNNHYQIRAELLETPNVNWRRQFQLAWYNSPECRRLCSDVQMDGSSIMIQIKDARQVNDTVAALKSLMAATNAQAGVQRTHTDKKAII